jgi:hypothetical protein
MTVEWLGQFNDDEKECAAWRAERIQTMNRFDVLDARNEEEKVCVNRFTTVRNVCVCVCRLIVL